ncbi:MAG: type II toxin-antitoxin system HicB family antitoxin [Campylobacteraceae bacterium]|nr:type II toxin-antitoxin system HicB family antitoxin [Campylobacteraceae bacterium]
MSEFCRVYDAFCCFSLLRINVINAAALKKIDAYIEPLHISRSAFLQKSALDEVERN